MIPSLKLLLRIFALTCCTYGGPIGAVVAILLWGDGGGRALLAGGLVAAALGVPFGACMALALGGWHILAVRRLGHRLTDETLGVRQRRRLTIDLPLPEAFALCLASVRHLGNAYGQEADYPAGVIRATKWSSLLTAGEYLRFRLRRAASGTVVEVESRPRKLALVDYGTSMRNLDAVVGFLLAHGTPARGRVRPDEERPRARRVGSRRGLTAGMRL